MKRLTLISLGVRDLKKSGQFFNDLFGWKPFNPDHDKIIFFNMGGWMVGLYPWELLAEDAQVNPEGSGFPGITLALNVVEKEQVAKTLAKAESLGGKVIKLAQDVFWGGHSGYFMDLDGHYWEVAYNPFIKTLADGCLDLPKV